MSKKNEPVVLNTTEMEKKVPKVGIFKNPVFIIPASVITVLILLVSVTFSALAKFAHPIAVEAEVKAQTESVASELKVEKVEPTAKELESVIEETIQDSDSKTITSKKGNTVNINTDINVSGANNTVTVNNTVNVE